MIKLEGITKIYDNQQIPLIALNSINLEIKKGDFIAIMGRSGCGKTTLLNILGCIDSVNGGKYYFEENDLLEQSQNTLAMFRANNIGFIFQAFNLIDELNCVDNVSLTLGYMGMPYKSRLKIACELLDKVGLADKAKSYPAQLSGGQQQRIAIARAIANSPKVILADEPTGNLDYNNGLEIMKLLRSLNSQGTTIVMATHDRELSGFASKTIQMRDGMITQTI